MPSFMTGTISAAQSVKFNDALFFQVGQGLFHPSTYGVWYVPRPVWVGHWDLCVVCSHSLDSTQFSIKSCLCFYNKVVSVGKCFGAFPLIKWAGSSLVSVTWANCSAFGLDCLGLDCLLPHQPATVLYSYWSRTLEFDPLPLISAKPDPYGC